MLHRDIQLYCPSLRAYHCGIWYLVTILVDDLPHYIKKRKKPDPGPPSGPKKFFSPLRGNQNFLQTPLKPVKFWAGSAPGSTKSHRLIISVPAVSSLEVRNRAIDTLSEIKKIPKLKFQIGRRLGGKSPFKIQSNVRVINVGMVMRSSVLSIWLLMIHIFELSFYRI